MLDSRYKIQMYLLVWRSLGHKGKASLKRSSYNLKLQNVCACLKFIMSTSNWATNKSWWSSSVGSGGHTHSTTTMTKTKTKSTWVLMEPRRARVPWLQSGVTFWDLRGCPRGVHCSSSVSRTRSIKSLHADLIPRWIDNVVHLHGMTCRLLRF